MKLVVLVDNTTLIDQYYVGEPAVSYYLEVNDNRILFDTGYSNIFVENAIKMGIDLKQLTHIVLSHGHNDHTNGLKYIIDKNNNELMTLIAHPDCFLPKYDGDEYIGAPFTLEDINTRIHCEISKDVVWLSENLIFLGEIPRENTFESQYPIGEQIRNGVREKDYVLDDTALVYNNNEGIFIITGCSHSGICNIVEYAKKVCREDHIIGIIGGIHLLDEKEKLDNTIEYFKQNRIDEIYPAHCVSLKAKTKMMNELIVGEVGVGMVLNI